MAAIAFARRTQKFISSMIRFTSRRFTHTSLPLSSAPWLRLPSDMSHDMLFVNYENFLNIVDKRLVKLDLQDTYGINPDTICVGSTRGWLAYLSESGKMYFGYPHEGGGHKCYLYNDQDFDDYDNYDGNSFRSLHSSTRCFTQAGDVLTVLCEPWHDPVNPTPSSFLEFFVSWPESGGRWSRSPHLFHKQDPALVYCDANKTAYKLSRDIMRRLWVELWDMSDNHIKIRSQCKLGPSSSEGLLALLPSDMGISERELRKYCHQDRHLVVTGDSGEANPVLYLVVRHHNRHLGVSQTSTVDVFRIDLVGEKMIYTTTLDDHAFFIGTGSDSFAIPIEKCPELKTDSIYIADDLKVFDLKERSISPIVDMGDLSMTRLQAFWVPPPSQEQIESKAKREEHRCTDSE